MRCPICNKETKSEGNPYRPFCSERCKMVDLDNWLSGRYRIPTQAPDPGSGTEERHPGTAPEAEID
ncbi:MAG TPA: DNA gyrase inhibitor YacG [Terriglobia bacterium]|nr:DNA gyrase inhibitor YacG [Terriglobia bacterium]